MFFPIFDACVPPLLNLWWDVAQPQGDCKFSCLAATICRCNRQNSYLIHVANCRYVNHLWIKQGTQVHGHGNGPACGYGTPLNPSTHAEIWLNPMSVLRSGMSPEIAARALMGAPGAFLNLLTSADMSLTSG